MESVESRMTLKSRTVCDGERKKEEEEESESSFHGKSQEKRSSQMSSDLVGLSLRRIIISTP